MKLAEAMYWIGEVMRNSETAIGSTSPDTDCGKPSRRSELSSIAGSVASEDSVLAATACTGASADMKCPNRWRPAITARPISSAVASRYSAHSSRM